jgi:hypothetical protein
VEEEDVERDKLPEFLKDGAISLEIVPHRAGETDEEYEGRVLFLQLDNSNVCILCYLPCSYCNRLQGEAELEKIVSDISEKVHRAAAAKRPKWRKDPSLAPAMKMVTQVPGCCHETMGAKCMDALASDHQLLPVGQSSVAPCSLSIRAACPGPCQFLSVL